MAVAGNVTPATLLILAGLPGAGKSTLAAALSAQLGWDIVDRDRIRAAMFPRCAFSEAEKDAAGESVWLAVEAQLSLARSCIVDGMSFARRRDRERAREIAELAGAGFHALFLDCPLALAQSRVEAQADHCARDRDAAKVAAVARVFEPVGAPCIRLDATLAPAELLRQALAQLSPTPASSAAR